MEDGADNNTHSLVFYRNRNGELSFDKNMAITVGNEKFSMHPIPPFILFLSMSEDDLEKIRIAKDKYLPMIRMGDSFADNKKMYFVSTYHIVSSISNFIVNLTITLEAYSNSFIDKNDTLKYKRENIDYNDILGRVDTITKMKKIANKKLGKNFFAVNEKHFKQIKKLIALRNDIIHIKPNLDNEFNYQYLFKKLLLLDCEASFKSVKSLIEFYTPMQLKGNWS